MHDDANASRVLWVYEDREIAANMDKKTRTRSVMDRVVSLKVCTPIIRPGLHYSLQRMHHCARACRICTAPDRLIPCTSLHTAPAGAHEAAGV